MKKIYNILLTVLIIAVIIVIAMIAIKYGKNQINEKEIKNTISELEEEIQSQKDNSEAENIETTYKGYNIEGILEIPKINIKYPILCETNDETMKISITKFWGPNVNEIGNFTMAGHNNRDGTMFGKTKYLEIGDIIIMTDLKNNKLEYQIFDIYSINPDDVSCVQSVESGIREITLITCTNGHKNRLIVKAREIN